MRIAVAGASRADGGCSVFMARVPYGYIWTVESSTISSTLDNAECTVSPRVQYPYRVGYSTILQYPYIELIGDYEYS